MKKHPIALIPAAALLLGLISLGGAYAQSPSPARKQLDKVIENTGKFDGSSPGKGGSALDTTVRPSTGTVPSAPVRPSTTTVPSNTLTKPSGTTTTDPNPRRSSIERKDVPSPVERTAPAPRAPVVKTQPPPQAPVVTTQPAAQAPQTKDKPKEKPATGTVPTGK